MALLPAHDALGVNSGFVEVHAESRCVGQAHDAALRFEWRLQEELVDLIPLDEVLQAGTDADWLGTDEVRGSRRRVPVWDDR